MVWFVLVVLAVAIVPFVFEAARKPADPTKAPGETVQLSQGITHYQWIGPVRGPVVVCIHGLTTPSPAWHGVAAGLGQLGYRVLVYDLYGRGFSSAPTGAQNRAFFLQQLSDLLDDQGLQDDLTLVGYSMGGAIATAFAAENPDRMTRVILVAPSGITMAESRFSRFCREVPLVGDWLHGAAAEWRARAALVVSGEDSEVPGLHAVQLDQLNKKGFQRAVLQSRLGMLSEIQETEHRKLGHDGIPVIALWGDQDQVIPLRALGQLTQWNRAVRQETVKGAGHGLPYTHATAVTEILRDVLRERD